MALRHTSQLQPKYVAGLPLTTTNLCPAGQWVTAAVPAVAVNNTKHQTRCRVCWKIKDHKKNNNTWNSHKERNQKNEARGETDGTVPAVAEAGAAANAGADAPQALHRDRAMLFSSVHCGQAQ